MPQVAESLISIDSSSNSGRFRRPTWSEGLRESLQRKRVELAAALLRNSDCPAAQIAADVGFCDQSHMTRGFRSLLSRTPVQVRAEQERLRAFDLA